MKYSIKDIKALSDLDAMRERPGMYVGECNTPSHLFQESIDNALDESIGGYASKIAVEIDSKNKIYTVSDNGRGIPLGKMKLNIMGEVFEKESLEVLTSKGHTGGKFGGSGYKISSGLHGIGLKCLSALSEELTIIVTRTHDKSKKWTRATISYSKGKIIKQEYKKVNKKDNPSGTLVRFKADNLIFDSIEIPKSYIINKCQIARAFGHNVTLIIDGEKIKLPKGGLETIIENEGDKVIIDPIKIKSNNKKTGEFMEVCLQYNSSLNLKSKGFTNLLYNSQGGTHVRWIERVIVEAWKEVLPKGHYLQDWDVTVGLRVIVAVFIQDTSFSSQTKERLTTKVGVINPLLLEFKRKYIKYLKSNPKIIEKMYIKFKAYRDNQNKLLASKEVQGLVKIADISNGQVRRKSVVEDLSECSSQDTKKTELFLCEGKSAEGSLKACRNPIYHATLPLRGKILNTANMPISVALKSKEILAIVNSIGCGVGVTSNASKSRYGKVIIAVDADKDGLHIATLIICALINLIPDMVKKGKVFIAESALYGYYKGKVFYPVWDKSNIPSNVSYTRFKGLGELNPTQAYSMFMDKTKRKLIQVKYPEDIHEYNLLLVSSKKELLTDLGLIINMK